MSNIKFNKMNKRALSNIVTIVLLILIGMSAVSVVAYNLFPLIDLSPEISCTKIQLQPPAAILSAEFDENSRDLEVIVRRKFNSKELDSLQFDIAAEGQSLSFACTQACGNCILPDEGSTSEYFFNIPQGQVDNIILSVKGCAFQSYDVQ